MKKITALVLALVMTLSLLPMNVWAAGEEFTGSTSYGNHGVFVFTDKNGTVFSCSDAVKQWGDGSKEYIGIPCASKNSCTVYLAVNPGEKVLVDEIELTDPFTSCKTTIPDGNGGTRIVTTDVYALTVDKPKDDFSAAYSVVRSHIERNPASGTDVIVNSEPVIVVFDFAPVYTSSSHYLADALYVFTGNSAAAPTDLTCNGSIVSHRRYEGGLDITVSCYNDSTAPKKVYLGVPDWETFTMPDATKVGKWTTQAHWNKDTVELRTYDIYAVDVSAPTSGLTKVLNGTITWTGKDETSTDQVNLIFDFTPVLTGSNPASAAGVQVFTDLDSNGNLSCNHPVSTQWKDGGFDIVVTCYPESTAPKKVYLAVVEWETLEIDGATKVGKWTTQAHWDATKTATYNIYAVDVTEPETGYVVKHDGIHSWTDDKNKPCSEECDLVLDYAPILTPAGGNPAYFEDMGVRIFTGKNGSTLSYDGSVSVDWNEDGAIINVRCPDVDPSVKEEKIYFAVTDWIGLSVDTEVSDTMEMVGKWVTTETNDRGETYDVIYSIYELTVKKPLANAPEKVVERSGVIAYDDGYANHFVLAFDFDPVERIFYRQHESEPWRNSRMEEPVGGNSRIFLALDEEGKLLDISTPWTASASENVGKVIVFGDILYWDRSQALPGATGTITITNGTDTYRLPVSIGVPWMLMFEGEISPENLVNPDENDRYYYPTDEDKESTVTFVPSADNVTIDSVDAPSDIGVRIAADKKSVTVTIPEGRHGEFSLLFNFTETFGEEQHKNYRSLWIRDDGAKAKLTTGKLIKESDYIQWESKDEIFHVNENVPVPFTLSIDGKEQTFYMLPAMINEGVLSSAWLNWCGIPTWSNEGGLYYAVDYWTSDDGGKDLAPISDELRGKINAMVESASITIAPVAGYEGNLGTRYPSSARGDDIPRNIRETFGNRLAAVGYCHNLDTLGMWQVKTTVKFKNGLELTTALSSKSEYLAVYDHPMEADATVADINAYIASFKENYPNANPQQSTLNLSLPGKELHGLIVVDPETAPKEIQLMGCEDGVGETVLYGSVYANNFSTRLMNIRMVGAGKNNTTYKDKGEIQWADELIGTPNYGVYGSAYGYIHCCSFTGYRTAVYSKADWYRFGMGYSLFYDNHTALYMECTDPNGGGVPTMAGNVYMNNQFALWLERFPTNFDTSTFGTDDNIFIDNQKDIHSGNRSYFAPGNAFGTLTSNGNKAVPNTTGKAHAAPYYGVTDTGLAVLSGNLSQLPLDTLSQELNTWIGDVKLYPNNWAVPNYGDAEIYMISVDDITDGMTISTIDKTNDSDNDVLGTIKLKKNK